MSIQKLADNLYIAPQLTEADVQAAENNIAKEEKAKGKKGE